MQVQKYEIYIRPFLIYRYKVDIRYSFYRLFMRRFA